MSDYEPFENFNTRLTVQTTYPDKVIDHRSREFYDHEYKRNSQSEPRQQNTGGRMKSVTKAPKPKAGVKQVSRKRKTSNKQDDAVKEASNKDLKQRNIKP